MELKKQRMQELVELLNRASKAYYQEADEIMSNFEYDKLYDELLELEKELGITMANSPTVNVGYEVLSELPILQPLPSARTVWICPSSSTVRK